MTLYFLAEFLHVPGAIVILGRGSGVAFFERGALPEHRGDRIRCGHFASLGYMFERSGAQFA